MFPFTWKTYLQCFSNIKCLPITTLPAPNQDQNLDTTSTTLLKNFNPLCDLTSTSTSNLTSSLDHDSFSNASDISSDADESPPDFATVFASQRFFFSSPGRSNSIFESPSSPQAPRKKISVPDSVAIQTYSPDPFQDFRNSMQEMVEAHGIIDVEAEWEFLHELLLCYLTLNPKQTHKFIIEAFSDLLVSLMSSRTCRTIDSQRGTASPRGQVRQLLRHRNLNTFGSL